LKWGDTLEYGIRFVFGIRKGDRAGAPGECAGWRERLSNAAIDSNSLNFFVDSTIRPVAKGCLGARRQTLKEAWDAVRGRGGIRSSGFSAI